MTADEGIATSTMYAVCYICKTDDYNLDGASNSYIPTTCPHFICCRCWHELIWHHHHGGLFLCPFCKVNISEWWLSHHKRKHCDCYRPD